MQHVIVYYSWNEMKIIFCSCLALSDFSLGDLIVAQAVFTLIHLFTLDLRSLKVTT